MYQLTTTSNICRLDDGAMIPADERNSDYVNYLAWVTAGNVPEPLSAPPVVVPHSVTRFQAMAALDEAGHLDAIEAIIADSATPRLYVLAWRNALTFERDSQTLAALATMLGLTDADLDALFIRAAEIKS